MGWWRIRISGVVACVALATGCVTGPPPTPATWNDATGPAWSYNALPKELAVDVSPAGDTMRWGGSVGTVVGRGVDVAQNASYRNRIQEALGDYDSARLLENKLNDRLSESAGDGLRRVAWLTSMAGHASRQAAEEAYYTQMARSGVDLLLEVQSRHGVFGADATVVTALRASLYTLPGPRRVWREDIVVTPGPAYAFSTLGDPTRTSGLVPRLDLRFGVDSDRIDTLTANGAALLKAELDESREGAVAALLVGMGLSDDPRGHYILGRVAMTGRNFDDAIERFERAIEVDPAYIDASSARAVAMAHRGELNEAIALMEALVEEHAEFAPGHANLAWWHATETGDLAAARRHLELAPADPAVRALLREVIAKAEGN